MALDDKMYVSKVTKMLQNTETYEVIKRDPTKVIISLRRMLVKWDADYISKYRILLCNDGILLRARLVKDT